MINTIFSAFSSLNNTNSIISTLDLNSLSFLVPLWWVHNAWPALLWIFLKTFSIASRKRHYLLLSSFSLGLLPSESSCGQVLRFAFPTSPAWGGPNMHFFRSFSREPSSFWIKIICSPFRKSTPSLPSSVACIAYKILDLIEFFQWCWWGWHQQLATFYQ